MRNLKGFNEGSGMGPIVSAQPSPIVGEQVPDNQPVIVPSGYTGENVITKFDRFFEDATATLGNTGGMGSVSSAQPSSVPGDVQGGTKGSGDVGQVLGTYTKKSANLKKRRRIKKVTELNHMEIFEDFQDEYITFEMTGSPKNTNQWRYKENFVDDLSDYGFRHTSLTKKTDILCAEDEYFGSNKWNKAKSFGIPIMTYDDVWNKRKEIYKKKFGHYYGE